MRSLLIILIFLGVPFLPSAQTLPANQPEQDACDALVICGNTFFTPYSYVGIGDVNDLPNSPCGGTLAGENNSIWLRLNVQTAGTIVFTIQPVVATDDYDFSVVDITNATCSTFTSANVVRCNFNNNYPGSNQNGIVGLNNTSGINYVAAGSFGNSFCQQINANAGDVYLIMINNFGYYVSGGPSSGFTLDFTGSTAVFNDNGPATMSSVLPACNISQELTLLLSEPIKCSSIAPDGSDFTIPGGAAVTNAAGVNCNNGTGYTSTVKLTFASALPPGNYTLQAQIGSDGNTLLDLCDHALVPPGGIQFTVPPYISPAFASVIQPACSELTVKLSTRVRCNSIASDGSDVTIAGPQAASVQHVYGKGCDTAGFTDTIVVLLDKPLQADGIYVLKAQIGTDLNTMLDSCGLLQPVGDDIEIPISTFTGLVTTPADQVLCAPGYISLGTATSVAPPFAPVTCGPTTDPCSGNIRTAFAGTGDSSTNINTPFNGQWQDARAQYLFLASELRAMGLKPGSVRRLELKLTQKFSSAPFQNFNIRMGCTPLTVMGAEFLSAPHTVYSSAGYSSVPGWNSFELTTAFNWDGESNIVVEMCYDNNTPVADDHVMHSITPFPSVLRRFGNNLSGCAIDGQGTMNTAATLRPRIRFYICDPQPGNPSVSWLPGDQLSDSTVLNPIAYIGQTGSYLVTAIDVNGCAHRDSISFIVSERNPVLQPRDTTVCFGEPVRMQAGGGVNYTWLPADPAELSCVQCPDPIVNAVHTASYPVVIRDQYDCADTLVSTIRVNQLPALMLTPGDTIVPYGTNLQLTVGGAYLVQWSPPNLVSNPNIMNPMALITQPVTFMATGISEEGCRSTDSVKVLVDYTDELFIPSAFTPNGDGKNDVFRIGSLTFQRLQEFRIFNRWGQEIFSTNDPRQGWDGTFNGKPQDASTYPYLIRVAYPDGKVTVYKGDVTLVR